MSEISFPRQQARTRRFTLGVPRAFTPMVGPDGPLVLFLRSDAGDDPVTHLWRHDPATGRTDRLVDARLLGPDDDAIPAEEQARRERAREQAAGIVGYAVDAAGILAAFTLGGRLHSVELATGAIATHPVAGPAFDPRPSPDGRLIAYHALDGLHVVSLDHGPGQPGWTRELVVEEGVSWGRAEFVAAEEMGRDRGFWWSGAGDRLAVARVDEREVPAWTIADPANPATPATVHRYPAAGTRNAEVSLWVLEVADGTRTEVVWDRTRDEYLAAVRWGDDPLTLLVQPRDQRTARVLTVEERSGRTTEVHVWRDEAWVELVPGSPAWAGRHLLTVEDRVELGEGGTRVLCMDGTPVTPAGLQIRELGSARPGSGGDGATAGEPAVVAEVLASPDHDPTRIDPYTIEVAGDGTARVSSATASEGAGVRRRVPGRPPREASAAATSTPWVEVTSVPDRPTPTVTVGWSARDADGATRLHVHALQVLAERPRVVARPRLLRLGDRQLAAALLLPTDDDGQRRLPVLLDPYGGPHAQRVMAANQAFLTSQWLADQGFAVLVVDGRGTPGRGPRWERAVQHDLATPVLADQLEALQAVAALEPRLDLRRVAIRGWSFGGYLAALAVLRHPEVFRAAIAGAPVTDWHLYDTHYTERYLGHPEEHPEAYRRSSLVDADGRLPDAVGWEPPAPALLLIHGLADDNVVAAHTLRLSSALLSDGRAHQVLPLSGVTHMTPQEVVAERLLTSQVTFLRQALA
ncbi:MAG: S9 family peptidase [Nitriliruptor sp.]|nr:MAG: S9 family peptidase [Nitriliruptor sp.]